jgi:hypothetical protein
MRPLLLLFQEPIHKLSTNHHPAIIRHSASLSFYGLLPGRDIIGPGIPTQFIQVPLPVFKDI